MVGGPGPSLRRWADRALIALFAGTIVLPAVRMLTGPPVPVAGENRPLAPLPRALDGRGLVAFPARFEAWFNDHLGFRAALIRWHNWVLVRWLGTAPRVDRGYAQTGLTADTLGNLSSTVLLGRDGWLFLSGGIRLESYRRTQPFTPAEVEGLARVFEERQAWLAERGIGYVLLVAPDKPTIYPEAMPASLPRGDRESHLDQLIRRLGETARVDLVDVRPALLAGKVERPVFPHTDTHWNPFGAYLAYRELLAHLAPRFPSLVPWPLDAFTIEERDDDGGDLADHLGLREVMRERRVRLLPKQPRSVQIVERHALAECPPLVWMVSERPDTTLPSAVLFHDSFMFALAPFLTEHFRRASFHLYQPFDRATVERERPDVVIDEIVERMLILIARKSPGESVVDVDERW